MLSYDYVISLGWNCTPAAKLTDYLGNPPTLPFDYIVSRYLSSVIQLLDNKCLKLWENIRYEGYFGSYEQIYDLTYSVTSFHDFDKKCSNRQDVLDSYKRKTERLFRIIGMANCPLFIRAAHNFGENYLQLSRRLNEIRSNRPYLVLILGNENETNLPPNFFFIKHNVMEEYPGNDEEWKEIFNQIELKSYLDNMSNNIIENIPEFRRNKIINTM